MPSAMKKKRKPKWDQKPCGCVKTKLQGRRATIRCKRHRGKPPKSGALYYFDDAGLVREDDIVP